MRCAHEQHAIVLPRGDREVLKFGDRDELGAKLLPPGLVEVHEHEGGNADPRSLKVERGGKAGDLGCR